MPLMLFCLCIAALLIVLKDYGQGYSCSFCGTRTGEHDKSCPWGRS